MFLGAASLLFWCLLTSQLNGFGQIEKRLYPLIALSGLFLVANWAALFEAYRLISIGFATIIYHFQTFWIVVFAAVFLNEKISKAKGVWLLLAFGGLIAVIWPRIGDIVGDTDWFKGISFAVLASMLYAGSTLSSRALKSVRPAHLTIIHCLCGMIVFAPLLRISAIDTAPENSMLWLIGLGVIHTGGIYIMIYASYPKLSIATIGICAFLNPLAAVGFGFLVFDEIISPMQIAGAAIIGIAGLGVTLGWAEPRDQNGIT
ncbi:DMT family transporter [Thalassobius sp. S69A]|uniref:DMT family transporter n=1 Tax=unclassified Thalassovita TaxID=2619711 RepID=UPI003C7DB5A9